MAALAWLAIPVAATLAAIVWVTWAGRARRPADAYDSMARHERFRQAMGGRPAEAGPPEARLPEARPPEAGRPEIGRD